MNYWYSVDFLLQPIFENETCVLRYFDYVACLCLSLMYEYGRHFILVFFLSVSDGRQHSYNGRQTRCSARCWKFVLIKYIRRSEWMSGLVCALCTVHVHCVAARGPIASINKKKYREKRRDEEKLLAVWLAWTISLKPIRKLIRWLQTIMWCWYGGIGSRRWC